MRVSRIPLVIVAAMIPSLSGSPSPAQVSGTYFGGDGGWGEANKWTSNPLWPDNGGVATFDCGPIRNFLLFEVDIGPSVSVSKLIVTNSVFQPTIESPFNNTTLTLVGPAEVETNRVRRGNAFLTYLNGFGLDHVAGTNGLVKTGPGVLQLGSSNTFTGDLTIRGGFLEARADDNWGPASNRLVLDGGGFRSPFTNIGNEPNTFVRTIVLGPGGGTLATTMRSNFTGVIQGAGALTIMPLTNNNPVALHADNTYTGATSIRGGTVSLSLTGVNGSIRHSSALNLNGGTVDLDNSTAGNSNRLNDTGAINLSNGTLNFRGNGSISVSESVGTINAAANGQIWLRPANVNTPVHLNAVALVRDADAAMRFVSLANNATVTVAQAPTLIGGDGSAGTNRPIIPFAINGNTNSNFTFIAYGEPGSATALHPLSSSEYVTSLAAASPDSNVDLSGSEFPNSPITVNALRARSLVSGPGTISITSGALLYLNASIFSPVEFGTAQGMIAGQGTLPGPLHGSNGVVFHNGQFTVTGASTYTGVTAIRNSTITLTGDVGNGVPSPFGSDTSAIKVSAGSTVQWSTSSPVTMSRSLAYDGTPSEFFNSMQQSFLLAPNAPTFTIAGGLKTDGLLIVDAAADGRVNMDGPLTGTGMLQAADGSLTVAVNSANNTFSGGLLLNRGTFLAGADNAFGTGSIQIVNGSGTILASGGPRVLANQLVTIDHLTFASGPALTFTGGADLNPGDDDNSGSRINLAPGADVTFAGPVIGGTLTVNGDSGFSGTLRLAQNNPQLASPIRVAAGTLHLAAPLAASARGGTLSIQAGIATLDLSNNVSINRHVLLAGSSPQTGTLSINSLSGNNAISTLSISTGTNIDIDNGTLAVLGTGTSSSLQARITKSGQGHLILPTVTVNTLAIQQGRVELRPRGDGPARLLRVNANLSLDGGFATPNVMLDLTDNDMIVLGTTVQAGNFITAIAHARNGGTWDQTGITSTAARDDATHATTLGVLTGEQYRLIYGTPSSFHGVPVIATDKLVKYTYYGDTDFNGVVNFDDYARIDSGFNNGGNEWFEGDFDLNGVVNFDDYALIDLAFNVQGQAPLLQAVPEPACAVPLAAALIAFSRRRRCELKSC